MLIDLDVVLDLDGAETTYEPRLANEYEVADGVRLRLAPPTIDLWDAVNEEVGSKSGTPEEAAIKLMALFVRNPDDIPTAGQMVWPVANRMSQDFFSLLRKVEQMGRTSLKESRDSSEDEATS